MEGQTEFTLSTEDISARVVADYPSKRTLVEGLGFRVAFANQLQTIVPLK